MGGKPKRQKGKLWTLDEHETALKMDLEGYSQYEIARKIGRTRASVQSRMRTLDYIMDKEALLYKSLMNMSFEVGATYLISEKDPPICIKFLPGLFVYEGKMQGHRAKHIFRSLNCGYPLTFTDTQLHGYKFQKEGGGNAERIRENAGRNKGGSAQEGDVTGEGSNERFTPQSDYSWGLPRSNEAIP